jgi:uncharacterized protein (TIGR03437 family)
MLGAYTAIPKDPYVISPDYPLPSSDYPKKYMNQSNCFRAKVCVGAALRLIVSALLLASFLQPQTSLHAQGENHLLLKKADVRLRRVYDEFHTTPGVTETALNEARQRERAQLRAAVRLEETPGSVKVGVIATLRDGDETAWEAAQAALESAGFTVRTRSERIVVLTIAVNDLPRLVEMKDLERVSAARYSQPTSAKPVKVENAPKKFSGSVLKNDQANLAVRAPEARSAYNVTGRGVVIGVIDTGIDWRHGDFKKIDGTTRVKLLWDISDRANTGPGGVGRVYTEAQINAALAGSGAVSERDTINHGSHVTGIAAGNGGFIGGGIAGGQPGPFAGIAPEADLIIVKANRAGSSGFAGDDQIAAIQFIRDQARALNAPFVINMSLGGHASQHDGTDETEKVIDTLLANRSVNNGLRGRQVVIAAGNEGFYPIHAGRVFAQGTNAPLTFRLTDDAKIMVIVHSAEDAFDFTVTKPNGGTLTLAANAATASDADVEWQADNSDTGNGQRNVLLNFKNKLSGNWQLSARGVRVVNGRVDAWDVTDGELQFAPDSADSVMHVGSPATARNAIAVASFVSKTSFASRAGTTSRTGEGSVGNGSNSSSQGPSRDGRLKPEIAAPGAYVMSTLSADTVPVPASSDVAPDSKHVAYSGTSMATPVTAGVIALMLQANPDLPPWKIKRTLWHTVTLDGATGPSVSFKFGYGKLNAFAAVKAVKDNLFANEFVSVNGASYGPDVVAAPDMILAGFGVNLATSTIAAGGATLPTTLGGVQVRIADRNNTVRLAQLFFVSSGQINYLLPAASAAGPALVEVLRNNVVVARGTISVSNAWPGLFSVTASGSGQGAANVLRYKPRTTTPLIESAAAPIDLGISGDRVFLALYGTGLRNKTGPTENPTSVKAFLGGTPLNVIYAGAQGQLFGLDQINVELPATLAGRNGTLQLLLYVDGRVANTVTFPIK